MLRSSCRWLPAVLVFGWLAVPATAQVEATFAKVTDVKPSYAILPKADTPRAAIFSPDGLKVATVDSRGVLRVVTLKRPEKAWSFPKNDTASDADATSVAWSKNEKVLVTGHQDGTVRAFDAATGEKIWQRKKHTGRVNDVAINRKADVIASASNDKTVRIYNDKGEQTYVSTLHSDRVTTVDLTYNGKLVLSGSRDGDVIAASSFYEPEKTTPILVRRFRKSDTPIVKVRVDPKSMIDPLEFTAPDHKTAGDPGTDPIKLRLLIADKAGVVTYYDLEKTKPRRVRKFDAPILDADLSSSGEKTAPTCIVATKKGVFAYRPMDADRVGFRLEIPVPYTVAIADDGKTCIVGGKVIPDQDKNPGTVYIYSIN
jgi:WD40 repeat protein